MENEKLRNISNLTEHEQIRHSTFSILNSQFPSQFTPGLVLTRVGTNETFSFDAPSDGTVQSEWLAFGAANDWFPVEANSLSSPGKWSFPLGTGTVSRLAVFSSGTARPRIKDAATFVSPLSARIGIAPSFRHGLLADGDRPSEFWHRLTQDNSLVLTWQNVLLGRDASSPVSFQSEFFENGDVVFRYDLGRLSSPVVSNVVVGVSADGAVCTFQELPTNVTSLTWRRVDPEDTANPDRDGDGISTEDEISTYGTDPHNPDTDRDGLSDYEEIFTYNTNPLDPNSLSAIYGDGLAVKLGGLDPFSFPEGSTNTVLEHVFYSGTTNGAFAFPQASEGMAVLSVSVSGSGSGDLVVGSRVVPLVAPPQLRSAPPTPAPPLLANVPKGVTVPVYLRGDGTLSVSLASGDFAFGELPGLAANRRVGWINFPCTKATEPCIHDYAARRKDVSLPAGEDAAGLTCTWHGGGDVEVENHPPLSAAITGNFSARGTRGVTYTLSHPKELFGPKTYAQTVRFCPQPPDPDPDVPDPPWYTNGDGGDGEGHDECWCCHWGACDEWCDCGCSCWQTSPEVGDEVDFDDECPVHEMPYAGCAHLHESDYTNAVQNVQRLGGVLYLREPSAFEQIHLDVPSEYRNCCPCPDHWTNYVGVAYKSHRLRLIGPNGLDFDKTETSCDVSLAGIYPSSSVGDATLAFSRNGEIYQQSDKTVLGVALKGCNDVDLAVYNALNSEFGCPMAVCTNLWDAPSIRLVTNVMLPDGNFHIELAGATGQFALWYYDSTTWEHRRLLDTASSPVKDLPMSYWKALMRRAGDGDSPELSLRITSASTGTVSIVFRYWNVIDGAFIEDQAVQRITSVNPPLLADADGDWSLGDGDVAAQLEGRMFRFWTNEDTAKGDYVGASPDVAPNASDLVVNGRLDLVNLFPVKLDLKPFIDAWGSAATFVLWSPESGRLRFCGLDASPDSAWAYQTNDVYTTAGDPVHAADLVPIAGEGVGIDPGDYLGSGNAPGVLAFEAADEVCRPEALMLLVCVGGDTLFSYSLPLSISSVRSMYRWLNIRNAAGGAGGETSSLGEPWNRPDEECDGRQFVFVHGYNVNPEAARQWADAVFKRLWHSGSRSMFTAVDWYGDDSQFSTLAHGDVSPDYYANVAHAFSSASNFVAVVDVLPGTNKVMLAHSLGNMLVSSAAIDHNLQYSRYYMLNAAVPMEAYDNAEFPSNMVDSTWSNVPVSYRASNWSSLFETNDFRFSLSWRGRFAGIHNAVNCYSETEDVLANPTLHGLGGAWSKQELFKGTTVWNALNAVPFLGLDVACEGGWGVNATYAVNPYYYVPAYGFFANAMSTFTREEAIESPLFTPFKAEAAAMHSTNLFVVVDADNRRSLRAKFLGDAIPATSFAAGANAIINLGTDGNINLPECKNPNVWPRSEGEWRHSDMKNVAYFYLAELYQKIVNSSGNGGSSE